MGAAKLLPPPPSYNQELSSSDFEFNPYPIGEGSFGQVYKALHKASRTFYAIKVINKANAVRLQLRNQIKREAEIMYKLDHEHIIKLHTHFEDAISLYLVMEYMPAVLSEKLESRKGLPEKEAARYMREIISAVIYIHSLNPPIVHRDIKPENILLDENGSVKLCDFGSANFINSDLNGSFCGTAEYLSPEMIHRKHGIPLDSWSIGILLYELVAGKTPFAGSKRLLTDILDGNITYPSDFHAPAASLANRLLKVNPYERISLEEALKDDWLVKDDIASGINLTANCSAHARDSETDRHALPKDAQTKDKIVPARNQGEKLCAVVPIKLAEEKATIDPNSKESMHAVDCPSGMLKSNLKAACTYETKKNCCKKGDLNCALQLTDYKYLAKKFRKSSVVDQSERIISELAKREAVFVTAMACCKTYTSKIEKLHEFSTALAISTNELTPVDANEEIGEPKVVRDGISLPGGYDQTLHVKRKACCKDLTKLVSAKVVPGEPAKCKYTPLKPSNTIKTICGHTKGRFLLQSSNKQIAQAIHLPAWLPMLLRTHVMITRNRRNCVKTRKELIDHFKALNTLLNQETRKMQTGVGSATTNKVFYPSNY